MSCFHIFNAGFHASRFHSCPRLCLLLPSFTCILESLISPLLANEAVWTALERKGLIKSLFPMAVVLTPSGLDYDTGLGDQILHRHAH